MLAFMPVEALFLKVQDKGDKIIHMGIQMEGKRALVVLEPFHSSFFPLVGFGLLLPGGSDQVYSSYIDLAFPLEQRKPGHMGLLTISLLSYRKDLTTGWYYT